ncbi:MAG TPA: prepilin-type N-terminal cleavage/methylation domain-containing protein [Vitreimonas sp.]|nr:prepilin-type N-terminal cleavage/methylation domain-containing protein [Vitreimonas sp.]
MKKQLGGFTLIEMLVVVTVMLLMVGGGIAAFTTFNDKQVLIGGSKELQSYIRSAQQKAQYGDKPAACDRLNSYAVKANQAAPVEVHVVAICNNGEHIRDTYQLNPRLSLGTPLDLSFRVLHGGTSNTTIEVHSTSSEDYYSFAVTSGGEITEGSVLGDSQTQPSSESSPSPSLSPQFSPSPAPSVAPQGPAVVNNAGSNLSCTAYCQQLGYTSCSSIGTDAAATNGRLNRFIGTCAVGSGNCSTVMTNQATTCFGGAASWTRCRCL